MIGAIDAYHSTAAIDYARHVIAARDTFSVPESQLRNNPVTETQGAQALAAAQPLRDPAADAVQLSQMYPQLLVGSIYTAAPAAPARAVMGLEKEPVGTADNQDRDDADTMGELLFGGRGDRGGRQVGTANASGTEVNATSAAGEDSDALYAENADVNGKSADGTEAAEKGGDNKGGINTEVAGNAGNAGKAESSDRAGKGDKAANGGELSEEQQQQIDKLKARDAEVKAHEQAHKAVGGAHAGAISYSYQQGPDGKRYAVGGEVSIDVSKEKTPEATIAKMQQVKAAANAPANPSGQDRAVAAEATVLEGQARQELAKADSTETSNTGEDGPAGVAEAAGVTQGGVASLKSENSPDPAGGRVKAASEAAGSNASGAGWSTNGYVNRFASRYEGNGGFGYGTGILGQGSSNSRLVDVVA